MKTYPLKNIKILLADGDINIARVVTQVLRTMGFAEIHHVRDSTQALAYIRENPIDILMTEWVLSPLDGIELARHIRLDKKSPNRGLPIVMLTGKGEMVNVETARDAGITEFLVKPFTIQTLFNRLEHLIDRPRAFLLHENYVGPDRRRRAADGADKTNRRHMLAQSVAKQGKDFPDIGTTPILIQPDYELKRSTGVTAPLASIITPAMLTAAQNNIDNLRDESLQWIKEDLAQLEAAFTQVQSTRSHAARDQMKEASLSIKSRAGTFGYALASKIARMLYLFFCTDYESAQAAHNLVVRQCVDALKISFSETLKAPNAVGDELASELQRLIDKQQRKGQPATFA